MGIQDLRNPKTFKITIWIILGITIPSFVLFYGFGTQDGGGPVQFQASTLVTLDTPQGRVELTNVDVNRARDQMANYYARLGALYGLGPQQMQQIFTAIQRELSGNPRKAADYAIGDAALRSLLASQDIRVTDQQVSEYLRDAGMTRQMLEQLLRQQRMSEYEYNQLMRDTLRQEMARQTVGRAARASLLELWEEYLLANEDLTVSYAVIPLDIDEAYEPTEEEIQAKYDELVERRDRSIINPPRYVYEYVKIPAPPPVSATVPDEAIREAYDAADESDAELWLEPGAQVRHVLIATSPAFGEEELAQARQRAESARERILAGEDFADIANELSDDLRNVQYISYNTTPTLHGGLLPETITGDEGLVWGAQWVDFVKTSEVGTLSPILETPQGYSVVRVEERVDERVKRPYEEVADILRQRLRATHRERAQQERQREIAANLERLRDAVATETTIAGMARQVGTEVEVAAPVSTTSTFIPGVGDLSREREALRDLPRTRITPVLQTSDGAGVVLRIRETLPESPRPLEEIREMLVDRVQLARASETARNLADELRDSIGPNDSLTTRALELGYDAQSAGPFPRQDPPRALQRAPEMLQRIVSANEGDFLVLRAGPRDFYTEYIVVHVEAVDQPSTQEFLAEVQELERDYVSAKREAYVNEFRRDALERFNPRYDREYFR